jgi:MFS superfamily sulfate permease-like transporter
MSHPSSAPNLGWRDQLTADVPASFVVFLVALPLCMGIAIASGAPVSAGLITGIVGGIVVGVLAGSPLQVSGPAAGLTVLVYEAIRQHGLEELGVIVLLAGAFQFVAGLFRLGQWFRAVSPAVVQGMLSGIGLLILVSQFHVMIDTRPKSGGLANLKAMPGAVSTVVDSSSNDSAAKLDSRQRLRILQETSMLHLRQVEVHEQVLHALSGVAPQATAEGTIDREPASLSPENDDEPAAAGLRALAGRQTGITESLERLGDTDDSPDWKHAVQSSREALADLHAGNVLTARASIGRAVSALEDLRDSYKSHHVAALIGLATISIVVLWQAILARRMRFVPAPLVAIGTLTLIAFAFDLPVLYVEVPDSILDEVFVPTWAELKAALDWKLVATSLSLAVIASAETLLCAGAVDQMHSGPRTRYDRELAAQGIGNMVCGLLSALPMTGVIVRSSANVQAGAKSRLSAILHGIWLIVFVGLFSYILRMIPTSALAAILVYTGYKLVNVKAFKKLLSYGAAEGVIYLVTMLSIVATDLLTGVLTGFGLSIAKLLYTFSRLRIVVRDDRKKNRTSMQLQGAATFLRLPKLAAALENVPPQTELHVNLEQLSYIDHACLDLLMNWEKQHETTGGRLVVDWESLIGRFRRVRPAAEAVPGAVPDPTSSGTAL